MKLITSTIILLLFSHASFANSGGNPFKVVSDKIYIDARLPAESYYYNQKNLLVYYQKLTKQLAQRNPIKDAQYAMRQGNYFVINHYTNPRRAKIVKQLGFPQLPKLSGKDIELLNKHGVYFFQGDESIYMLRTSGKFTHSRKRIYKHYIETLERYRYYWNRTVTYGLLQKARIWKYQINRVLRNSLNSKIQGKLWKHKDRRIIVVPSLPPYTGHGGTEYFDRRSWPKPKYKTISNPKLIRSYYKSIYYALRTRNPIADAKLAIKKGDFYFIKPHRDLERYRIYKLIGTYDFNPHYPYNKFSKVPSYAIQGERTSAFIYVRDNAGIAGDDSFDSYSAIVYFYTYHWNKTMVQAVLQRMRKQK